MKKISLLLIIAVSFNSCNVSKNSTKKKEENKTEFSIDQKISDQISETTETTSLIDRLNFSDDFQLVIHPDGGQNVVNFGSFSYYGTSGIEIKRKSSESKENHKTTSFNKYIRNTTYETLTTYKSVYRFKEKDIDLDVKPNFWLGLSMALLLIIALASISFYFKPILNFIRKIIKF